MVTPWPWRRAARRRAAEASGRAEPASAPRGTDGGRERLPAGGKRARRLPRRLRMALVLRSLLVQATWNFERMQHLGFCFAILPVLRWAHPDPRSPARGEAVRRHLEFFNTNPIMAAAILGAAGRLEADGEGTAAQTCKLSLMGSYGAIGDSFFWGALRPAAGIAGVTGGLVWTLAGLPGGAGGGALVAALVALVLFNVPALWVRAFGVAAGARLGIGVIEIVRRVGFPELTARVRGFGAAALGLAAAVLLHVAAAHVWGAAVEGAPGGAAPAPPAGVLAAGYPIVLGAVLAVATVVARGIVPTRLAWVFAAAALAAVLVV
ncbi:MAG TPA: PTS system mannose/fructose/sorbose family transporter subunit IID [Thermodesulfobacteriota bacterium]